jgi:hypothetical protein
MGSLVKCAACNERCGDRPVGVYWRWMRADGVWKHYYHRICVGCFAAKVLPLDQSYDDGRRLTCPACGVDTEDDYDGIYTTSFPGKGPQLSTESPFCDACAVPIRVWVQEHARDTDDDVGAPGPRHEAPSSRETLRDLGRVARAV